MTEHKHHHHPPPPSILTALKTVSIRTVKIGLALHVLFVFYLLMFLGSAWKPATQYKRIHFALANYDRPGGIVGDQLIATYEAGIASGRLQKFTYHIIDTAAVPYEELRKKIDHGDYHGGWIVVPGATDQLEAAAAVSPWPHDRLPPGVLQATYDEGRGGVALSTVIKTASFGFFQLFNSHVAIALSAAADDPASPFHTAPAALLARPLHYTEDKLHTVPYQGAANMSGFVWAVLWTTTFSATIVIFKTWEGFEKAGCRKDHVMLAKLAQTFVTTLCASVLPISIIAMLGLTITAALFFKLWAFMWLAQSSFLLIGVSLSQLLGLGPGLILSVVFFIFNLISSTGTYPQEFMSEFFLIGYGLPMYQGCSGTRTILFGSYDRLAMNVGLLVLWLGIMVGIYMGIYLRTRRIVHKALLAPALPLTDKDAATLSSQYADEPTHKHADKPDASKNKKNAEPVGTLSFFSAEFAARRKGIRAPLVKGVITVEILLFLLLIFFLGASWNPPSYYSNFKIAVADYDGGYAGQALTGALDIYGHGSAGARQLTDFSYTVIDPSRTSLADLRARVNRGEFSAAYVINPGTSRTLDDALAGRNAAINAPFHFIFDEGRAGALVALLMRRSAQDYLYFTGSLVSEQLTTARRNGTYATGFPADGHTIIGKPLALQEDNLHPVTSPGANNLAGQVWIIVMGIAVPIGAVAIGITTPFREAGLSYGKLVGIRIAWMMLVCFSVSIWPPAIVSGLGYKLDAMRFFQCWGFLFFIQFCWSLVVHFLGETLKAMSGNVNFVVLILSLISSTAIYPMEYMTDFFKIGYALPMYHGVTATRTILFGSYDRLGLNVGVVFGWIGLMLILTLGLIWHRDRAAHAAELGKASTATSTSGDSDLDHHDGHENEKLHAAGQYKKDPVTDAAAPAIALNDEAAAEAESFSTVSTSSLDEAEANIDPTSLANTLPPGTTAAALA